VLTERGLTDAIRALSLDAPIEVTVGGGLPGRPERPVESAVYFVVAELLTNVAKHARATHATVEIGYQGRTLTVAVTDDGTGGAAASDGSGLSGVRSRRAAFDGQLDIDSPVGGPTRITVTVPCVLS
jgi:signal transduction histidine kinase